MARPTWRSPRAGLTLVSAMSLVFCPSPGWADSSASPHAVTVVTDLTEAGKKLPAPTQERPAYFLPIVAAPQAKGQVTAGVKIAPPLPVVHALALALARQHYLLADKVHPPSLVLIVSWGYQDPLVPRDETDFGDDREMLALVAGNTLSHLFPDDILKELQRAHENRDFMVVVAADYAALVKHEKKLLWIERMSVAADGITLEQAMPALVTAGQSYFGRETRRPQTITETVVPEGSVVVGAPVVVPSDPWKAQ